MTADERDGLLLTHVSTRQEVDRCEYENILDAERWLGGRRNKTAGHILTEKFIKELHAKMFGNVWRWAGKFRQSEKTIGMQCFQIIPEIKKLCDDALYWVDHSTYSPDEMAIVFHHRLVSIHPFPNGNGRHSRLMADVLIQDVYGQPRFSWGAGASLIEQGESRDRYLEALRSADNDYDYKPLLVFARS